MFHCAAVAASRRAFSWRALSALSATPLPPSPQQHKYCALRPFLTALGHQAQSTDWAHRRGLSHLAAGAGTAVVGAPNAAARHSSSGDLTPSLPAAAHGGAAAAAALYGNILLVHHKSKGEAYLEEGIQLLRAYAGGGSSSSSSSADSSGGSSGSSLHGGQDDTKVLPPLMIVGKLQGGSFPGATYFGAGNVEKIRQRAEEAGVDRVFLNVNLTPRQLRNLEQELGLPAVDRTCLIVGLFAKKSRGELSMIKVGGRAGAPLFWHGEDGRGRRRAGRRCSGWGRVGGRKKKEEGGGRLGGS